MGRGRPPRRCRQCGTLCTEDHLSVTCKVRLGTLVLSYPALYLCSEVCFRAWSSNMIWHADDDPRVLAVMEPTREGA